MGVSVLNIQNMANVEVVTYFKGSSLLKAPTYDATNDKV